MKTIALIEKHLSLNAKIINFAGFDMPLSYDTGIIKEHDCVRSGVGVFDVSHMGEFLFEGVHALELIQRICCNDASKLIDGKVQYSCLTNEKGGIIDDVLVYRFNAKKYMLVVNAGNIQKDWDWIIKYNTKGVKLKNISEEKTLLSVQGPKAIQTLQKLTDISLADIPYYSFKEATLAKIPNVIISATGYTGAGGFELYLDNIYAEQAWNDIFQVGKPYGVQPIGLGARDTLRLEKGFCLYGNDIDENTTPLEAGLAKITKLNKNFIGSKYLKIQQKEGANRHLVGFEMLEQGIPRHGYIIFNGQGIEIGRVTSGTCSPSLLGKNIGMGYVSSDTLKKGETLIKIGIRGKQINAKITNLPFL